MGDAEEDDDQQSELDAVLEEARAQLSEQKETVADVLHTGYVDALPDDDLKPGSTYDLQAMVNAWIYRFIAPSEGYSMVSWDDLADRLASDADLATSCGFDPDETPTEKTMRSQWWTRISPEYRTYVRYMAADRAVTAEDVAVETASGIRQNLIDDFQEEDDEPDHDPIGELEQEIKDRAYEFQSDLIRDLCSYDRDDSTEYHDDLITDAASHMCRLNEYAEQGIDRMATEYGLDDCFSQQTFRRTVRNVERSKVGTYDWGDSDDSHGAEWVPPHELVDPAIVRGDLREALEEEWAINPHNPEGETSRWHRRTEEGIGQQVEWLREEGVIEDDDSFRIRIDYTTHDYTRHSSTESRVPIGVHKQTYLDTGYAWKELQATIKINGHAFVIASVNYLPTNTQFQCVRYLIDRAQELVDVDMVLADAEFATVAISRYAEHCGVDYTIRKGATTSVKDTVEEKFEDDAGWVNEWTMMTDGNYDDIDTTLVGVEKNFKSKSSSSDDGDDGETVETTLSEYSSGKRLPEGQATLSEAIDEDQADSEEIDYFCMITSKRVKAMGINPDENPVAHDPTETAWGIGRIYRDRWSVETGFRDRKRNFQAKTRSRDLGYRRYLWMIANLIYNGWVMLNAAVADESPDRDDWEIVVKQNTYLDELDRRVLSKFEHIEFPEVDYG